MSAWKILLTDGLEENGKEILRKSAEVVENPTISADELLTVIGEYDALIVRGRTKVTPALLAAGKKLKVVGRAGVGVDNIDLAAAREHKITVVNSPLATTVAVAELTMGLMLSLVRDLSHGDAGLKAGKWLKKEMEGTELFGVSQRARAFEMKVLGYDPFLHADQIQARGAESASLDQLFARSDIITLHLPLTDQTRGMLNEAAFAKMKQGVYVICAARGGVIDEAALLAALDSGKVAGAALDVYATEPPGMNELISHPRLIGTPHIGAQTVEAQTRAAHDIAEEVLAALASQPLRWKVA
jgi:D-3-phosphoglycerate dehydrogenase